jgi:hypothetical protein
MNKFQKDQLTTKIFNKNITRIKLLILQVTINKIINYSLICRRNQYLAKNKKYKKNMMDLPSHKYFPYPP